MEKGFPYLSLQEDRNKNKNNHERTLVYAQFFSSWHEISLTGEEEEGNSGGLEGGTLEH